MPTQNSPAVETKLAVPRNVIVPLPCCRLPIEVFPPPALLKVPADMSIVPAPPSRPRENVLFWFTVPPVIVKTPLPNTGLFTSLFPCPT